MKKKIAILGSTGSIGKTLLNIISKDKKSFDVQFLSAQKNYKELIKQAIKFNVKNIVISNHKYYNLAKLKIKNENINLYNNFDVFNKIFKKKLDYTMSSIIGIDGLLPTLKIIKHTNKIAIANKESIICAWSLIKKKLNKHKTTFIPVDSEHFSTWYALNNNSQSNIQKIYLTASGGPLLNVPVKKFDKLNISQILRHPNWNMGNKISIDSSTMMNKVFEVIEAKKIFNIDYKKILILIHPKSYVHSIIKFNDGMIKIVAHDTTMKIPIFNSLYLNEMKSFKSNKLEILKLNNLNFEKPNLKKFPLIKILKKIPNQNSLFETVLVSANDELVNLYLNKKIKYTDITKKLFQIINMAEYKKLKKIVPKKVFDVLKINQHVRLKTREISV